MAKTSKRKKAQMDRVKAERAQDRSRRDVLRLARNGLVGVTVLGAGGFFMMRSVHAMQAERDLSRIGQGKPVVVQVHDPQCATCTALQRETRSAMKQFGECDLIYLVADVSETEGATLANKHGVPHVTLLLFDGNGELQQTLRGMRHRDELRQLLAQHQQNFSSAT
ncbi:hypothetical protein RA28_04145 [Ruegeria sp. ANG-S4]|uniref:thioredoxin family protein n=1 Tax=Ruegeria sp. ANG-S4 TaxID=1577904 RepID=UPI00057CD8AE|nr:thioredoxin family protein [Ruegeria sp. ANG-S4]KIC46925.1 hypothetical protein RA28_04145 [Ruegeria sp. ANG-S4]